MILARSPMLDSSALGNEDVLYACVLKVFFLAAVQLASLMAQCCARASWAGLIVVTMCPGGRFAFQEYVCGQDYTGELFVVDEPSSTLGATSAELAICCGLCRSLRAQV